MLVFFLMLYSSCNTGPPYHIPPAENRLIFDKNESFEFESFTPTRGETDLFEKALIGQLEGLTKSGKGYERKNLDEIHPLEYTLGWFKRRYFGKIDSLGNRKIYTELVFVRCVDSDKWKQKEYPNIANSTCWWSAEYDLGKDSIVNIDYP